ncbi:hypothetical protein [Flavobacterium taihuense]|uniref:DUF1574 domain-containing protein n=1 Tax=Flavobacterium taihuense TaxID=2857508 RepID=A0ABS6XWV0_9FLAO|nr:hypothetical protein [Flavobacterium taihuense]MBW4361122.1 hypothetical protein [Flavobacterium taihuense]
MNIFVRKVIGFLLPVFGFIVLAILLPATPRATKSLLFSSIKKDSLLKYTKSPRIIFVGGSNLSFGLNSQLIKDSLRKNPINTAIHASLTLKFMLDNSIKFVKKGDVVVLVPEYSHFYSDYDRGSEELLRIIFDVNLSKISLLSSKQLFNIIPYMPKLAITKLKPSEYLNIIDSKVYSVNSFNDYGDTFSHWGMKRENFKSKAVKGEYNTVVLENIKAYALEIEKKGAQLFVSFPGYQDVSFMKSINSIHRVEMEYRKNDFIVLGTAERYKIPDAMMFNTPYHLNKDGVDYRTQLLIEDLKKVLQ